MKLGAFIVPTGIGASIGGFAGDASAVAREFAKYSKLIVNPNVVNAGCFSGITDNMLYVEGYSLDRFFKGEINLRPVRNNKIAVIFDKAIPQDVLNVHINTINAVKTVYGTNIIGYEITDEPVGVKFDVKNGVSAGSVENIETLLKASRKANAEALALVCFFEDANDPAASACGVGTRERDEQASAFLAYAAGLGVDPIGGVEAILSHYISKELKLPCAHSPAFADYQIYPDIVDARAAAEYITPTFLPCVLLGLANAPQLDGDISIDQLDYLVMPYGALGSTPVFEALKRGIKVFAVKENVCALNVTAGALGLEGVIGAETYEDVLTTLFK